MRPDFDTNGAAAFSDNFADASPYQDRAACSLDDWDHVTRKLRRASDGIGSAVKKMGLLSCGDVRRSGCKGRKEKEADVVSDGVVIACLSSHASPETLSRTLTPFTPLHNTIITFSSTKALIG